MASPNATAAESRAKQSAASKRATFAKLSNKGRASREITVQVGDEELVLVFKAISAKAYDKLLGDHPPTAQQKLQGNSFNLDTFGPAIIAAVCTDPDLTEDEAKAIWESEDWSRGEIMTLFNHAVEICNQGMDVPFSVGG